MSNATTFVGLDVHARPVKACAFVPETGETIRKSFGYEPGEIASWVSSLPQPARCVYESGVTGFHLCRELNVYCQPHVDKIGVVISTLSAFCVPTAFPTSEICQA